MSTRFETVHAALLRIHKASDPNAFYGMSDRKRALIQIREWANETLAAVAPSGPQDEVLFRAPADWCELFGVIVLDPDGWRADGQSWDQPVTREEFNRRANMSTIGPRSILSNPQETG